TLPCRYSRRDYSTTYLARKPWQTALRLPCPARISLWRKAMALQGEKLTQAIEHELMLMLASGYEEAPITPASLHKRLVAKAIIKGKLSSLSSRRPLIDRYANLQMERAGIKSARD